MARSSAAPELPDRLTPYPVVANIDFAEGPIFDDAGYLYFVNYLESGTLGRMAPDGTVEVWVHTGGRVNGLKFDGNGHIVGADYGGRRVTRFDLRTRKMEVLTDEFEGLAYNGPNDVCLDAAGNVYFTDPGDDSVPAPGAVYRIDMGPDNRPARVRRLDGDLRYPNGLAYSPGWHALLSGAEREKQRRRLLSRVRRQPLEPAPASPVPGRHRGRHDV